MSTITRTNLFKEVKIINEYLGGGKFVRKDVKGWDGDHWKVTLKYKGKQYTFVYSKGYGHSGKEPDVKECLYSLMSDYHCVAHKPSLREFAEELGYDENPQEAKRAYEGCIKSGKNLIRLLGSDFKYFEKALEDY